MHERSQAQTCLGFSQGRFISAVGAVRSEWSEDLTGLGATIGYSGGRLAWTMRVLNFRNADGFDQRSNVWTTRFTFGVELPTSALSLCPVAIWGREGVSSRDFASVPTYNARTFGGGLAVGRRFTLRDAGLAIVPSVVASIESLPVERIGEGDNRVGAREATGVVQGGVTLEFGKLYLRPYASFIAADNGWVTGGALLGVIW